jgi:dihydropyrimidine dehydrogenase (NADP+)
MPEKGMGRACSDVPEVVEEIVTWVRKYYSKPVFVKLSPNSTITDQITLSVLKAGGVGVSATNTMYSFMDPDNSLEPYPAVGPKHETFFGGGCGSFLRPIALRVATQLANNPHLDAAEIMATGGIISAHHALSYAKFGRCSVFQIASAVQEQDFSIIQDLNTGLRAALYLTQRDDLRKKGWKGQSPPTEKSQTLKKYINNFNFWAAGEKATEVKMGEVPTLKDIRGTGSRYFKDINYMSKEQKFPVINNDLCVNCGKCYMTCLDSGYQAITFSSDTHKPEITADCTGCGLCFAVCPVPGALEYGARPEKYPYVPQRGDKYF